MKIEIDLGIILHNFDATKATTIMNDTYKCNYK